MLDARVATDALLDDAELLRASQLAHDRQHGQDAACCGGEGTQRCIDAGRHRCQHNSNCAGSGKRQQPRDRKIREMSSRDTRSDG